MGEAGGKPPRGTPEAPPIGRGWPSLGRAGEDWVLDIDGRLWWYGPATWLDYLLRWLGFDYHLRAVRVEPRRWRGRPIQ